MQHDLFKTGEPVGNAGAPFEEPSGEVKLYRTLALSNHWFPRMMRRAIKAVRDVSVPAPRLLAVPFALSIKTVRSIYYFIARVAVCEPFFKAQCRKYGRNLHTGVFLHWIQGRGELIIGDNVMVDGKCSFGFATRYSDRPTLIIGDNTGIGHQCAFTVGDRIAIGRNCRIAGGVLVFDAPGHPLDPAMRLSGQPATRNEVRPIVIQDNVWIGARAIIMPGVTIGHDSVVAAGSVVAASVPPGVLVAGNPARQLKLLVRYEQT